VQRILSRAADLLLVLLVLPAALLLGGIIALAILADSPGSILYRARRVGRDGHPFRMLKFRKMRREAAGPSLTTSDDERFTPIGRFLATTKLDELPQLWNVLKGEMRLVGPRPEDPEFVELYREDYERILSVTPGITGLAQLRYASESQLLGDVHESPALYSEEILPHKIELDLRYIDARSLAGDLLIMASTALLPLTALRSKLVRRLAVDRRLVFSYLVIGASLVALAGAFTVQAG